MKKKLALILSMIMVMAMASACGSSQSADVPATEAATAATEAAANTDAADAEAADASASQASDYEWTQNYNWKFTHEGAPGMGEEFYTTAFAEALKEKSDGHIELTVFDFNQLGAATDQSELVLNGTVEFGLFSTGALSPIVPEVSVFGLHYVLPSDMDDLWDFLKESETVNLLNESLDAAGYHPIEWDTEGPHIWSTKKAINSLADMNGIKFRTQANQLEMASFNAYGASTVNIPYAEIYSALQLGTIDGQQQTGLANNMMNYFEVSSCYVEAHASYYVEANVCNKAFWEGLDPYVQNIIMEASAEAREKMQQFITEEEGEKAKATAAEHGIEWIEFDEATQAEFAEASVKARDTYLEIGGPNAEAVLDTFLTELGKK